MDCRRPVLTWDIGSCCITAGFSWVTVNTVMRRRLALARGPGELAELAGLLEIFQERAKCHDPVTLKWGGVSFVFDGRASYLNGQVIATGYLLDLLAWLAFALELGRPPSAVSRSCGMLRIALDGSKLAELSVTQAGELARLLLEAAQRCYAPGCDRIVRPLGGGVSARITHKSGDNCVLTLAVRGSLTSVGLGRSDMVIMAHDIEYPAEANHA